MRASLKHAFGWFKQTYFTSVTKKKQETFKVSAKRVGLCKTASPAAYECKLQLLSPLSSDSCKYIFISAPFNVIAVLQSSVLGHQSDIASEVISLNVGPTSMEAFQLESPADLLALVPGNLTVGVLCWTTAG